MTYKDTPPKMAKDTLTFHIVVTPGTWFGAKRYLAELPEYHMPVVVGDTPVGAANALMVILNDKAGKELLCRPLTDPMISRSESQYKTGPSSVIPYAKTIDVEEAFLTLTEFQVKVIARNIAYLEGKADLTTVELSVARMFACWKVERRDGMPLYSNVTTILVRGETFICLTSKNDPILHSRVVYYLGEGFVDKLCRLIVRNRHLPGSVYPKWVLEDAKADIKRRREKLLKEVDQYPDFAFQQALSDDKLIGHLTNMGLTFMGELPENQTGEDNG